MKEQIEINAAFETGSGCNYARRKTVMFGLILITFGVFWMLKRFDMLEPVVKEAVFSWQALVIAIGLVNVVSRSARYLGLLLILAGSFFMLMRFNLFPTDYSAAFWPALIILTGVWVIFGNKRIFRKRMKISTGGDDTFEEVAVFGGSERKVVTEQFKGGEAISVFGGSVIDLTRCQLAPGIQKIELVAVFGGVKLIVPPDWNIRTEMVNVMGGFSDKRNLDQIDAKKLLVIEGVAVFGGGEITT